MVITEAQRTRLIELLAQELIAAYAQAIAAGADRATLDAIIARRRRAVREQAR